MTRHTPANCRNEDCPACERAAEQRDDDPGYASDWQLGQSAYEREIEGWGPQT